MACFVCRITCRVPGWLHFIFTFALLDERASYALKGIMVELLVDVSNTQTPYYLQF